MHDDSFSNEQLLLSAYDEYADAIFRHCALRLNDRERGKDLMQDTFVRAWGSMQKGTTIENMRAFLYRIANNLIVDDVRRRKLRTEESLEEMQEEHGWEVPDAAPDPSRVTHGVMVMETVSKLEEPYRTAVVMRYVDGLPPRDIADALGVTPNVVSVRIHRGIEQLSALVSPSH